MLIPTTHSTHNPTPVLFVRLYPVSAALSCTAAGLYQWLRLRGRSTLGKVTALYHYEIWHRQLHISGIYAYKTDNNEAN